MTSMHQSTFTAENPAGAPEGVTDGWDAYPAAQHAKAAQS